MCGRQCWQQESSAQEDTLVVTIVFWYMSTERIFYMALAVKGCWDGLC